MNRKADAIVQMYIETMSNPIETESMSDNRLLEMAKEVALKLQIDMYNDDRDECAMAKFWVYLILGQNDYGRRFRNLFDAQDACSVAHAKFVATMVETFFKEKEKIKASRS